MEQEKANKAMDSVTDKVTEKEVAVDKSEISA